jgi:NAD(P)-dependent dehydrogenase (short-subunit alcohol dehydrogenase family)
MSLKDKIVVITGAGHPNGIGAGIARCFANEGARVVITDLEGAPIDETVASIPGETIGLIGDAADQQAMAGLMDVVVESCGGLDVLVNNAGIGGPRPAVMEVETSGATPLMAMTDESWNAQLEANLRTAFSSSHAAIPRISDGGAIVNIASIAGLGGSVTLPAYGAAKAGVIHLTSSLAIELAPRRIRVNCICPGLLYTRAWEMMTERMKARQEFANMDNRQIFETIVANAVPLGGEQTPEDIGNLAVFYASDKARMITGQVVAVDGGMTAAR